MRNKIEIQHEKPKPNVYFNMYGTTGVKVWLRLMGMSLDVSGITIQNVLIKTLQRAEKLRGRQSGYV